MGGRTKLSIRIKSAKIRIFLGSGPTSDNKHIIIPGEKQVLAKLHTYIITYGPMVLLRISLAYPVSFTLNLPEK